MDDGRRPFCKLFNMIFIKTWLFHKRSICCTLFSFKKQNASGGDVVTSFMIIVFYKNHGWLSNICFCFNVSPPGRECVFTFLQTLWKASNNLFTKLFATPGMGMGGGNNIFVYIIHIYFILIYICLPLSDVYSTLYGTNICL